MATGNVEDVKETQIVETLDFIFYHLMIKNPIRDLRDIERLYQSLYDDQCFKEGFVVSKETAGKFLRTMKEEIKMDLKARLILKSWIREVKPSLLPHFREREIIKGIIVLLSAGSELNDDHESGATDWLKVLYKKPTTQFKGIAKDTSIFISIFNICKVKDGILKSLQGIETWMDLQKKLKEFMINDRKMSLNKVLTECNIKVSYWEDFVRKDDVFNTAVPVCLPFIANMLKINIKVFKYPEKEVVYFFCRTAHDVTIELCLSGEKFVPVVPLELAQEDNKAKREPLKAKIKEQQKTIVELEEELKLEKSKTVQNEIKIQQIENDLQKAKENLKILIEKLRKAKEEKRLAMIQVAEDLYRKQEKEEEEEEEDSSNFIDV